MAVFVCSKTLFILVTLTIIMTGQTTGQANCPGGGNYAPCTCSGSSTSPTISCVQVAMATVADVFSKAPSFTTPINFDLRPAATDTIVPANIMGSGKFFANLNMRCPSAGYELRVDANAFPSSANYAKQVTIASCNLASLDLAFLSSFSQLIYLALTSSSNLDLVLPTLRPQALINLDKLSFYNSRGLNNWSVSPPSLAKGLIELDIGANQAQDLAVGKLLQWVASSSATTLEKLYMDSNAMATVPSQMPSFTALNYLDMSYNQITAIGSGAIQFTAPAKNLLLSGNNISTISHAAFMGNFTEARVVLQFNSITKFESPVFETMLNQILQEGATGSLSVSGNPFDCNSDPCHMSWLMRDQRHTTSRLDSARCSDNRLFKDLDPESYNTCPSVCQSQSDARLYEAGPCSPVFYQCNAGVPVPMTCASPSRLVFNGPKGYCDYPNSVPSCASS